MIKDPEPYWSYDQLAQTSISQGSPQEHTGVGKYVLGDHILGLGTINICALCSRDILFKIFSILNDLLLFNHGDLSTHTRKAAFAFLFQYLGTLKISVEEISQLDPSLHQDKTQGFQRNGFNFRDAGVIRELNSLFYNLFKTLTNSAKFQKPSCHLTTICDILWKRNAFYVEAVEGGSVMPNNNVHIFNIICRLCKATIVMWHKVRSCTTY